MILNLMLNVSFNSDVKNIDTFNNVHCLSFSDEKTPLMSIFVKQLYKKNHHRPDSLTVILYFMLHTFHDSSFNSLKNFSLTFIYSVVSKDHNINNKILKG